MVLIRRLSIKGGIGLQGVLSVTQREFHFNFFLIYNDLRRMSSIEIYIIGKCYLSLYGNSINCGRFFCSVFRLHYRLTKSWNLMLTMILAKYFCEHEQQPSPSANVLIFSSVLTKSGRSCLLLSNLLGKRCFWAR